MDPRGVGTDTLVRLEGRVTGGPRSVTGRRFLGRPDHPGVPVGTGGWGIGTKTVTRPPVRPVSSLDSQKEITRAVACATVG